MSSIYTLFLGLCLGLLLSSAQAQDTVAIDSVKLNPVDSARMAHFQDSVAKSMKYPSYAIEESLKQYARGVDQVSYQTGQLKYKGERWILIPIFLVLLFFALIKQVFERQLGAIFQAFFNNRILGNLMKEDNTFGSWPFLLLFILFGFSLGLFLYQAAVMQGMATQLSGPELFLSISGLLVLLFVFKILALRFLGFFFQVQKATLEYIAILSVTYFNVSMVFIPLACGLAFASDKYKPFLVLLGLGILIISFGLQALRAAFNILSQNRFSKVYLLLYFCTLEICPILILIRALGF
ncbi:MAG: DUF4271 domain-containing protein [Pedobacter sp.]|nr:MAG: DUF4271 domain-containing protein [Pedobacter sp.]